MKDVMVAVTHGKTAHVYAVVGNLPNAARRALQRWRT
jgi:FlaG/FlaF family flagellin (archaellin)